MKTTGCVLCRCLFFLCLLMVLLAMAPAYGEVPVESFAQLPLAGDGSISPLRKKGQSERPGKLGER